MKIILASSSKQRQDIFKMIGLKYEVVTSNVDEMSNEKNPEKYVEELLKTIQEQTGSAIVQKKEERYSFVEITD